MPDYLRPLAITGFITGWRKGELLSRSWRHVNLNDGWLRLEPGETKNGEARMFPLSAANLRAVFETQHQQKIETEKRTGRIVEALFFNYDSGEPIRDFRGAWAGACKRAGCPDMIFHDLRRTAARNLVRAGVAEPVAMRLTGHLTSSIFQRYAIVDETMLIEGADKLSALHVKPSRKVLPIER